MTPAKRDERIPQTYAFREFVYGQPTSFVVKERLEVVRPHPKPPEPAPVDWSALAVLHSLKEAA